MKVSVLMTVYNQEKYVAQAIESVLMQRANFDYEIVIGEDGSKDNTRHIIIAFQERYPDKIRLLLHDENKGLGEDRNFVQCLKACRGQYIAILDGDDYWLSPEKLQKQVDFLDSHPDYSISCHRARMFYEDGSREPLDYPFEHQKENPTLEDLLSENFIVTSSVMLRNGLVEKLPGWYFDILFGDWPLYVLYAEQGKINYMDDVMVAYRQHSSGSWSMQSRSRNFLAIINFYERVNEHLNFAYDRLISDKLFEFRHALVIEAEGGGDWPSAKSYARHCLQARPFHRHLFTKFKMFLRVYAPPVFKLSSRVYSRALLAVRR